MKFICTICNREYPVNTYQFRCICGGPFKLNWKAKAFSPYILKNKEPSLWRYRELIPINDNRNIISLGEGFTPLIYLSYKDFKKLLIKLDFLFPTGSFKDRGSTVMISKLKEMGIRKIVEDSSGNAGASIACYSTLAGIECKIYCPANIAEEKLIQIKAYGSKLIKVSGNRADTALAVQKEAEKTYYASHNWNPFFLEGIKTLAYEICEQLNWQAPDVVICPIGYGSIYLGLYYGFMELLNQKIIKNIPRLFGIQSKTISPIYQAFIHKDIEINEVSAKTTLANGIACVKPIRGKEILDIARLTKGGFEIVSEREIIQGWKQLAKRGVYVEPTSAVVIRALDHLLEKKMLTYKDFIVLILTGIGLKATTKLAEFI